MRKTLSAMVLGAALLSAAPAAAETFNAGSLIIPMDTSYQDDGMFKAYGLVYELLRNDIPVHWVIRDGKQLGEEDFTASATDHQTGASISSHGYHAGPWVIDASNAAAAIPIIDAWQGANITTVHEASAPFTGDVAKRLIVAPTIAMFADGNEDIAREYVLAAGIPDSALDPTWPDSSPDMLDVTEVSGPTTTNHHDGALFDEDGDPVYCQLMSMHWGVKDAEKDPEVVAEVRSFLNHPTHFFAECQAVNAFENDLVNGLFLTTNGFNIDARPDQVDFYNHDSPFGQIDGPFETVGGSEPSYTLPPGDSYKAGGISIITEQGTPEGVRDVWMTGYLDGVCPPDSDTCGFLGKVSYLGGHHYNTAVPISANPDSQGTRMFLNSLFEAQCATEAGRPHLLVSKEAPAYTTNAQVEFVILYSNSGSGVALNAVLADPIPAGSSFVSASNGGTFDSGTVTWHLGNLGANETGAVSFSVDLPAYGTYENTANLSYRVGLNSYTEPSNTTTTEYGDTPPDGGSGGSGGGSGGGGGGSGGESGSAGAGASAGADGGVAGGGAAATGNPAGAGDSEDSGGCGCRASGSTSGGWAGLAILLLVGVSRRRRGLPSTPN